MRYLYVIRLLSSKRASPIPSRAVKATCHCNVWRSVKSLRELRGPQTFEARSTIWKTLATIEGHFQEVTVFEENYHILGLVHPTLP